MAIWLPGYTRHVFPGRTGYPFQYMDKPKLCWHTTEGGSVSGALGAYAPYPPHLIANPWSGEKLQHISLDLAAYSAMDNNDDDHIIQVEIVGFAGASHTWPEWVLRWLADNVVKPIRDAVGVPNNFLRFYGEGEGIILASPSSPIRLSAGALRNFSGHLGHQHLSAPDSHWDPGRLNIARILELSGNAVTVPTGEEDYDMSAMKVTLGPGKAQTRTIAIPAHKKCQLQVVPAGSTVTVHALYNWSNSGGTGGNPGEKRIMNDRVGLFDIPAGTGKTDLAYSSDLAFDVVVLY